MTEDILTCFFAFANLVPPSITKRSNATLDMEDGDNATLQCTGIGKPLPSIIWTKDNRQLLSGNGSTALVIPNIELKDAGSYVCKAVNLAGTASYSVQVRVVRCKFAELRGNSIQLSPEGEVNSGGDIQVAKRRGIYLALFTDPEGDKHIVVLIFTKSVG